MKRTPFVIFGVFAAICLIGLPLYAFAKEGSEDTANAKVASADVEGKDLFVNNCGYCHTLAAAGTDGVVGPNLDELLVPSGENAPGGYEGLYQRVINAVECGVDGRMPEGILQGEEAADVSGFVAAYAGQIEKGPTVDLAEAEKPVPDGGC